MRVSHGTMKTQGPVLGMKKLARAFIRGDLDRADRIDTALVKIAGCTKGGCLPIFQKLKRLPRNSLEYIRLTKMEPTLNLDFRAQCDQNARYVCSRAGVGLERIEV